MTRYALRVITTAIIVVASFFLQAALPRLALADSFTPDRIFRVTRTSDRGPVVEVGRGTDISQVVDAFREQYRSATGGKELTWREIYAANSGRKVFLPFCAIKNDGRMWRGRDDTSVWEGCAPERQGVIPIAYGSGRFLIPLEAIVTIDQKVACYDSAECLAKRLTALDAKPPAPEPETAKASPEPKEPAVAEQVQYPSHAGEVVLLKNEVDWLKAENARLAGTCSKRSILDFIFVCLFGFTLGGYLMYAYEKRRQQRLSARVATDVTALAPHVESAAWQNYVGKRQEALDELRRNGNGATASPEPAADARADTIAFELPPPPEPQILKVASRRPTEKGLGGPPSAPSIELDPSNLVDDDDERTIVSQRRAVDVESIFSREAILEEKIARLQADVELLEDELRETQRRLDEANASNMELAQSLQAKSAEQAAPTSALRADLTRLADERSRLLEEVAAFKAIPPSESPRLREELGRAQERLRQLGLDFEGLQEIKASLEERFGVAQTRIEELQRILQQVNGERELFRAEIENLEAQAAELRKARDEGLQESLGKLATARRELAAAREGREAVERLATRLTTQRDEATEQLAAAKKQSDELLRELQSNGAVSQRSVTHRMRQMADQLAATQTRLEEAKRDSDHLLPVRAAGQAFLLAADSCREAAENAENFAAATSGSDPGMIASQYKLAETRRQEAESALQEVVHAVVECLSVEATVATQALKHCRWYRSSEDVHPAMQVADRLPSITAPSLDNEETTRVTRPSATPPWGVDLAVLTRDDNVDGSQISEVRVSRADERLDHLLVGLSQFSPPDPLVLNLTRFLNLGRMLRWPTVVRPDVYGHKYDPEDPDVKREFDTPRSLLDMLGRLREFAIDPSRFTTLRPPVGTAAG